MLAYALHTIPYCGLGSGSKRAYEHQPNIELINDAECELFNVIIPRAEKVTSSFNQILLPSKSYKI